MYVKIKCIFVRNKNTNIMKTLETLKSDLQKLHDDYMLKPLTAGKQYDAFYNKYKALQSKIRNYNKTTQVMKRAGLKTSKSAAGYKVEYKGNVYDVFLDGCETDYWSVYCISGKELDFETYDTKLSAIYSIYTTLSY